MAWQSEDHVWVWPVEARWGPLRTVELRISDPRDLEPDVRRAAEDPDRPWQTGVAADRATLARAVDELAPYSRQGSNAIAAELLRRLQAGS